jgi:hypothetical protein
MLTLDVRAAARALGGDILAAMAWFAPAPDTRVTTGHSRLGSIRTPVMAL